MMAAAQSIVDRARALADEVRRLPLTDQVEALNAIVAAMAEAGPFADQPVAAVQWVPVSTVKANDYAPGVLDSSKRALLRRSIADDGMLVPLVTVRQDRTDVVVDGGWRLRIAREKSMAKCFHGYVPVVRVRPDQESPCTLRAITHRLNAARGTLAIDREAAVFSFVSQTWDLATVAAQFGYSPEFTIRLHQIVDGRGILDLYADRGFGRAHTMIND